MTAIDPSTTVSFTGYRVNKLFRSTSDPQILYKIGSRVERVIEQLYDRGYRTFLNGMAEGFDLIAAKRVISLKFKHSDIKLITVVPYPKQAAGLSDLWRRYHRYCSENADTIITTSPNYSYGCFYRRNDFLIDNCSLLVCYYDGQPGGTRYTTDKAHRQKIEIINIYELDE